MKIKYIDTLCTNGAHLIFNASILSILSKIYGHLYFFGEKKNIDDQLDILRKEKYNTSNIKAKSFFLPIGNSRIKNAFVYILSYIYNIFFVISSDKNDFLFFNYNNSMSIKTMNFINIFLKRNIIIFCHGEMQYLKSDFSFFGIFNKFLFNSSKKFFLNKNIRVSEKLVFFVIGDSTLKNLKKILPNNFQNSFFSIDHPYFFNKDIKQKKSIHNINIGSVGQFYRPKGADDFCKLISLIKNDRVRFSITGRILYDIEFLKSLNVNLPSNNGKFHLNRDELENRINELDYIIYLYPRDSYNLMASGAILDAINMRKPIIALKNDYFCYMFEKFGHFGYLFDSIEEIAYFINNINKDNIGSFDFDSIQKKLSVENIANDLKEKLQDIGWL